MGSNRVLSKWDNTAYLCEQLHLCFTGSDSTPDDCSQPEPPSARRQWGGKPGTVLHALKEVKIASATVTLPDGKSHSSVTPPECKSQGTVPLPDNKSHSTVAQPESVTRHCHTANFKSQATVTLPDGKSQPTVTVKSSDRQVTLLDFKSQGTVTQSDDSHNPVTLPEESHKPWSHSQMISPSQGHTAR